MNEHEYLTVAEIAEHFRVSDTTVRKLIKKRKLAAIKIGKNYRIRREDFERLINSQAVAEEKSQGG